VGFLWGSRRAMLSGFVRLIDRKEASATVNRKSGCFPENPGEGEGWSGGRAMTNGAQTDMLKVKGVEWVHRRQPV